MNRIHECKMKAPLRRSLDTLPLDQPQLIVAVHAPDAAPQWSRWLAEIGFLPGEPVAVVARARPGGDPLVVRIGPSTFALRRAEAACVEVMPAP
jgi:ferrous iron transport protein A